MRLLGAARLSNDTDASTSIERQSEQIRAYERFSGNTLVTITEDVDVSGKVSPFDRPELGPWLNGKRGQWDALVVAKLDRISRSIIDFGNLLKWCTDNGKSLICLDPNIDFSTPNGRMFGNILMSFAEWEREMIGMRVADRRRSDRSKAWWTGGQGIPFGYRAVKVDNHHELVINDDQAEIIRSLAQGIISGKSTRQVTRELNDAGIPAAKGGKWDAAITLDMLRNQALRGYVMHKGEPVRGDDGMPVTRDAILDDETWRALQDALNRNARPDSGIRHGGALLLRIIYCGNCGQPLYIHRKANGTDTYRHGPKAEVCRTSFSAKNVESAVEQALMTRLATVPMREKVITPAEDHTAELARVTEQLSALQEQYLDEKLSAEMFAAMASKLESRQNALSALPSRPETTDYLPTGKTFREHWDALSEDERHTFLLDSGVTAYVIRSTDTEVSSDMIMSGGASSVAVVKGLRVVTMLGDLDELRDLAAER
jgi:site-specific DNA recombinase